MSVIEIRAAAAADLPVLANTLAEAFGDDPVWSWMIPPSRHHQRLRHIFGAVLRYALPHGHVYTTADRRAVAVWAPPGQWKLPPSGMVRAAIPILRGAGVRLPRLLGRLDAVEKEHDCQPPEHWYLEYIGAAADARGGGLGSALLTHGLARVDAAGLSTYLESSNPRNLSFYRRHGFDVAKELSFAGGPPQWTLWRSAPVA